MSLAHRPRVLRNLAAIGAGLVLGILSLAPALAGTTSQGPWTAEERTMLRSLTLSSLPPLPADRSNQYADNDAARRLGNMLFHDTRLSDNGRVSCGTCHLPEKDFQDGIPLGKGVGTAGRRTMPIAGTAHSPWQFWDGRADSHWAQALGPLESAVEHGGDRLQYARIIRQAYRAEYESLFGALPDLQGLPERAGPVADTARANAWTHIAPARRDSISRVFANIGKAIAAYERQITFTPTRFDRFVEAELAGRTPVAGDSFSDDERAGLRLFLGKANCVNCHNGPLLTDNHFHNTGVPQSPDGTRADSGRATGARDVVASEFNCLSHFSDAKPADCSELRFAVTEGEELVRAYKTPSLRNAVTRAPFMHAGQLASVQMVLLHYNRAPKAPAGHSELKRLGLSSIELRQLGAFLQTLVSPVAFPPLVSSATP